MNSLKVPDIVLLGYHTSTESHTMIKKRTDFYFNLLEEAEKALKKQLFVGCIILSCCAVESCIKTQIERELGKIEDTFVKVRYLKLFTRFYLSDAINEYQNMQHYNIKRIDKIVEWSKEINELRNKYVHGKMEKFKTKKSISKNETRNDATKSLRLAFKTIGAIGIESVMRLHYDDIHKIIENPELKKIILNAFHYMDNDSFQKKLIYKKRSKKFYESTVRVFRYAHKKSKHIDFNQLREDLSIIKSSKF